MSRATEWSTMGWRARSRISSCSRAYRSSITCCSDATASAYGNLAGRRCAGLPSVRRSEAEARAKVEDIIDFLELAPYRNSLVSALPYGVRKVVELGRALATQPRLLLLDEPASGLNPEEARDLAFWIDDIRSDLGITVVMVEHDMSLVAQAADRVMCMNAGQLLAIGTASEVQSNPDVIAAYLGA